MGMTLHPKRTFHVCSFGYAAISRSVYRAERTRSGSGRKASQDGCILLPMQMSDVYWNHFSGTIKLGWEEEMQLGWWRWCGTGEVGYCDRMLRSFASDKFEPRGGGGGGRGGSWGRHKEDEINIYQIDRLQCLQSNHCSVEQFACFGSICHGENVLSSGRIPELFLHNWLIAWLHSADWSTLTRAHQSICSSTLSRSRATLRHTHTHKQTHTNTHTHTQHSKLFGRRKINVWHSRAWTLPRLEGL